MKTAPYNTQVALASIMGMSVVAVAALGLCNRGRQIDGASSPPPGASALSAKLVSAVASDDIAAVKAASAGVALSSPIWLVPSSQHCYPTGDEAVTTSIAHMAASQGAVNVLREALKTGDMECMDSKRDTPILVAVFCRQHDVVRMLLDAGANPAPSIERPTALEWAVGRDDLDMVILLGSRYPELVQMRPSGGRAPVLNLAGGRAKSVEIVRWLVAHGASLDQLDSASEWTPLHAAAAGGDPLFIATLVELGAAVDSPATEGTTPLHVAARYTMERPDAIRTLLQLGASPMAQVSHGPKQGYTPLDLVIEISSVNHDTVKILLERGAYPTARTLEIARTQHQSDTVLYEMLKAATR